MCACVWGGVGGGGGWWLEKLVGPPRLFAPENIVVNYERNYVNLLKYCRLLIKGLIGEVLIRLLLIRFH